MSIFHTKVRWSSSELDTLQRFYPSTPSKELAKIMNRTPKSVRSKASSLGVVATLRNWSFPRPVRAIKSSADLSYLIGAFKGDGSLCRYSRQYRLSFAVKDLEFIETVQKAIGRVVSKTPKIFRIRNGNFSLYKLTMSNKDLFTVLNQPLTVLKRIIEAYSTEFLKGFFDAEGSAWISCSNCPVVKYSNTDKELILYVRSLLDKLDILPSPKIIEEEFVHIKKQKIKRPKPLFSILIQKRSSVVRFMKFVGSSIPRKRLIL